MFYRRIFVRSPNVEGPQLLSRLTQYPTSKIAYCATRTRVQSKAFNPRHFFRSCGIQFAPQTPSFNKYRMASVDSILAGKYPAKAHARKVVEYIRKSKPDATGVLYLEGQKDKLIEDNDETVPFR